MLSDSAAKYDGGAKLPFEIGLEKIFNTKRYSYFGVTIFFVVCGDLTVCASDKKHLLKSGDVILINPDEIHEAFSDDGAIALVLRFAPNSVFLDENAFFDCCSENSNAPAFSKIKSYLSKIFRSELFYGEKFSRLALFYDLLSELSLYFSAENRVVLPKEKYDRRIRRICDYIENNYQNSLSLQDVADNVNLSTSYLSNFFKKWCGKSFLSYYTDVRLDHAVKALLEKDVSIEKIAFENGFSDPRSFVSAFKKRYHALPSDYRKSFKATTKRTELCSEDITGEEFSEALRILSSFELSAETSLSEPQDGEVKAAEYVELKNLDVTAKNKNAFKPTFNSFLGIPSAHDLLLSDIQNILRRVSKETGFKYIRFHGIFSDDMGVYREDENGNAQYSYFLIDNILDFIISIGLKPIIELSFMPKDLARDPEKTLFSGYVLVSEPKSLEKWRAFCTDFVNHLTSRYGVSEMQSWLFSVWNNPDSSENLFGFERQEDFFEFYKESYLAIKSALPTAKIGTPSFASLYCDNFPFIASFLDYCAKNDCPPEFINFSFSYDVIEKENDMPYTLYLLRVAKDKDGFGKAIAHAKSFLQTTAYGDLPVYISSWAFTNSSKNLLNDTCFISCLFVKDYLENFDSVDALGYWCLSDQNTRSNFNEQLFHGGRGMFTKNGIEKSIYNALKLLSKLDSEVIYRGNGYFITRSYKKLHVMLYNYVQYSDIFADGALPIDKTDRYKPFNMNHKKKFTLSFENVTQSDALVKKFVINRDSGSCFDTFVKMGDVELKYDDELEYLKKSAGYAISLEEKHVENGSFTLEETLLPLEVRLIEIRL